MSTTHSSARRAARAGFTLIELAFASAIFALVLLGALSVMEKQNQGARSTIGITLAESRAQELLYRLERDLAVARGFAPVAQLTAALPAAATGSLQLSSSAGFPNGGMATVDRGLGNEETLSYDRLDPAGLALIALMRGQQCSQDTNHALPSEVRWAPLGEVLAVQTNPPAGTWDGRASVLGQTVFFRGQGTGFAYQVPVDPTNSNPPNFLSGHDVQWGAAPNGAASTTAWNAIVFEPRIALSEAEADSDLNGDGDRIDVFDVGQLRRLSWDAALPSAPGEDVGLSPTIIMQERCAWGSDLDGDGFEDPMFLWNAGTRELCMRLFIVSNSVRGNPIARRVESVIYLRNPSS